jgi:hypothetical protein
MLQSSQQMAGQNFEILKGIVDNLKPIQAAGPEQFGFAPAEEAALRTNAAEQLNAAGSQVANAVRGAVASRGGGTTYLPSGSEDSILGALAQETAVKEAEAQSGITQKGYDIGRQNWEFATEGLTRAPGALEAPIISAEEGASGAAQGAFKGAQEITAANRAWEAPVGKLIGAGLTLIPGAGPFLGAAVSGAANSLPGGSGGGGSQATMPKINFGGAPVGSGSDGDWGQ